MVRSWFALRTSYDPHRPLDGGGGDPHQARVSTLMYLDAHGYHLGFPLSLAPSFGVLYTNNKQTYAHRRCRKMSWMQHCAYLSTAPRCSGLETGARMRDKRLGEPTESVLCRILDRNFREHPFQVLW